MPVETYYNPAVEERLYDEIDEIIGEGARVGERVAKAEARVDSGAMRADTHATRVGRGHWVLWNGKRYSIFNELGRVGDPGKPFMRPGLAAGGRHIDGRMRARFRASIPAADTELQRLPVRRRAAARGSAAGVPRLRRPGA